MQSLATVHIFSYIQFYQYFVDSTTRSRIQSILSFITYFGLLTIGFICINSITFGFAISCFLCMEPIKLGQSQMNQIINFISILCSKTSIIRIKWIGSLLKTIANITFNTTLTNIAFTIYLFITAITALNESYYYILFKLYYYCILSKVRKHCNVNIQSIPIFMSVFGLIVFVFISIEVFGLKSNPIRYLFVILVLLFLSKFRAIADTTTLTSIAVFIVIITAIEVINITHNETNSLIKWILYLFVWITFVPITLESNISIIYPIYWITAIKSMLFVLFLLYLWFSLFIFLFM